MNLLEEIKECFDRCILSQYDGPPSEHPIIYLNSIKNIIGDNKKNPSKILLDRLKNQFIALLINIKIVNIVATVQFRHSKNYYYQC